MFHFSLVHLICLKLVEIFERIWVNFLIREIEHSFITILHQDILHMTRYMSLFYKLSNPVTLLKTKDRE